MYERIYDPGMGYYRPRGALVLCTIPSQSAIGQWGWGFYTVRGGLRPGDHRFVPRLSELYMYGRVSNPGMGKYPPRGALVLCTIPSQSAIVQRGWGFHTVRGDFRPGDHRFRAQVVGVVKVWKGF